MGRKKKEKSLLSRSFENLRFLVKLDHLYPRESDSEKRFSLNYSMNILGVLVLVVTSLRFAQ